MTKRVQILRHTGTDSGNFVGREGEVTGDTTNKKLRFHDGETPGGVPAAREDLANVAEATTTVAGKMSATDKAKLDGIEAGAQVNLDAAGIKVAYESNADTNAYTDADKNDVTTDLPAAIAANTTSIGGVATDLAAHEANTNNPHDVTPEQTGLKEIVPTEAVAGVDTDKAYVTAALLNTIVNQLSGHLGDHKWGYYDPANIPVGWILGYDGASGQPLTLGNAASGADYAGDEYQLLFNRIYLRCSNSAAPVSGGRVDAATDWAANKTITIPNASGRTPVSANPASHDSLSIRSPGVAFGTETHLLTSAQSGLRDHTHTYTRYSGGWVQGQSDGSPNVWFSISTQNTGGSGALNAAEAHPNTQPSIVLDMIIKYR